MGAGISKEQYNRIVYRLLRKAEQDLRAWFPEATISRFGGKFIQIIFPGCRTITYEYRRINASNGESAALLYIAGKHEWGDNKARIEAAREPRVLKRGARGTTSGRTGGR